MERKSTGNTAHGTRELHHNRNTTDPRGVLIIQCKREKEREREVGAVAVLCSIDKLQPQALFLIGENNTVQNCGIFSRGEESSTVASYRGKRHCSTL